MNTIESDISVVIISKDTKEMLGALLDSIRNDVSLRQHIKEIIVIDNASTDGTDEMILSKFREVTFIKNSENKGFAASANIGITVSTGSYILLLNSDTLMIKGEMVKMLEFMDKKKDTGICGPQLVYEDMKHQRSFAYRPAMLTELIPKFLLELVLPSRYASKNRAYDTPVEVDSLIGAAIMLNSNAVKITGGFDERFFFFLEETDLCLRIKKAKYGKGDNVYKVIFYPLAKIVHLQGKTVSKNWISGRIEYNISLHKFIKKHHNYFYYAVFSLIRCFKCFAMLLGYTILPFLLYSQKQRAKYKYYLRLFAWYLKGCPEEGGLRPNFPARKSLQG